MIFYPNAKINLGLHVHDRGSDGYHDIETVFCPVDLADILEIIPAEDGVFDFRTSGLPVPGDPASNLVVRAFQLMQKEHRLPEVKIHLHKIIPMGAGLGGGSSDAAFTVKGLNELFSLNLSEGQMMQYTRLLGSDCTFFIRNKTSLGYGRGDQLEPVMLDLSDYRAVIVVPAVHVNTGEAYGMIDAQRTADPASLFRDVHRACHLLNVIESGPASWNGLVHNDFEIPVFSSHPLLAGIRQQMYQHGAIYSAMSGSGSAIYGIFQKSAETPADAFGDFFTWTGDFLK